MVDGVKRVPIDIHFIAVVLISLPNEKTAGSHRRNKGKSAWKCVNTAKAVEP